MKTVTLLLECEYGDIVYLKTDPDQLPRLCTGFTVRNGYVEYELSIGMNTSWHSGVEISHEKTYVQ